VVGVQLCVCVCVLFSCVCTCVFCKHYIALWRDPPLTRAIFIASHLCFLTVCVCVFACFCVWICFDVCVCRFLHARASCVCLFTCAFLFLFFNVNTPTPSLLGHHEGRSTVLWCTATLEGKCQSAHQCEAHLLRRRGGAVGWAAYPVISLHSLPPSGSHTRTRTPGVLRLQIQLQRAATRRRTHAHARACMHPLHCTRSVLPLRGQATTTFALGSLAHSALSSQPMHRSVRMPSRTISTHALPIARTGLRLEHFPMRYANGRAMSIGMLTSSVSGAPTNTQ
jgi:hypothetical protein